MKWEKRGHLYRPKGNLWWAQRYALLPTFGGTQGSLARIYFAATDEERFGRIGYLDCEAANPFNILHESPEPVLDIGELGCFDDSGVNPSSVVIEKGVVYLYYIGWQRTERVPYLLFTGLAISDDGGRSFVKQGRTPILDRTESEPFIRSAPCVLLDRGQWRMWYVSGVKWIEEGPNRRYETVIRHATSPDGIAWKAEGPVCLRPTHDDEHAVTRPWVIREGATYRMWYSSRSVRLGYRMGYAESTDGLVWTRDDSMPPPGPSAEGWDSEMACYPCVADIGGTRHMLYNGNGRGTSGFGYAIFA